mmetsp:Transcript_29209/g.93862  ORF Transcript_29209/g.93862 Transcript_29209/m.93862 type:complete len:80 (-) Transcript_29209:2023-2262(-)
MGRRRSQAEGCCGGVYGASQVKLRGSEGGEMIQMRSWGYEKLEDHGLKETSLVLLIDNLYTELTYTLIVLFTVGEGSTD